MMATFATKHVNNKLLEYNPEGKIRIRFSLMPQKWSTILEPNTSKIIDRIKAVNNFIEAGYDVHLNFSPVIVTEGSGELYSQLFNQVNTLIKNEYKTKVKSEVIMMTHSENMHKLNLMENPEAEDLLWFPDRQELKKSSYQKQATTLRYKWQAKAIYIKEFKKLYNSIIPWCTIRYIF